MNLYQIFSFLCLALVSIVIVNRVANNLLLNRKLSLLLLVWHTMFCFFYWFYTSFNLADANNYYETSFFGQYEWSPGTKIIVSFTTVLTQVFGLNKLNSFLVYNLFGTSALLLLSSIFLTQAIKKDVFFSRVFLILLLMPTLSFWSCSIGKDSPAFFSSCLASFSMSKFNERKHLFLLSVVIMLLVRPHIGIIMIVAFGLSIVLGQGVNLSAKVLFLLTTVVAGLFLAPFLSEYIGLQDNISIESTTDYVAKRQSYNLEGGSSVDISEMPFYLQIFTYLFRPLFLDANNVMGVAVSVDNLLLLAFSVRYLPYVFITILTRQSLSIYFNTFYTLIVLIVLAPTTSNLGIAIRQKTMILPSLLFLVSVAVNNILVERQFLISSRLQGTK
jgi:hypothetical protein